MIVVDLGCMPHNNDRSVEPLIERFQPEVLFGFDPHPDLVEGIEVIAGTVVVRRRMAAWLHDGTVPLKVDGICTGVDGDGPVRAQCFSLISFLRTLTVDGLVLKLDVEGGEYPLLADVAGADLDLRLGRVLVEWHTGTFAHGFETERPSLRCPVEAWSLTSRRSS